MRRTASRASVLSIVLLLVMALVPAASAAPQVLPPPWEDQWIDNDLLENGLRWLEVRSGGDLQLEVAGETLRGNDIWMAKVGDPDNTPVMIIGQQHGDETTGSRASLELLRKLTSGSAEAEAILDELYVLVVPRVNMDGATLITRGNVDFGAPPRDDSNCFDEDGSLVDDQLNQGRGVFSTTDADTGAYSYDINRYHWPDWSESWQVVCNPDLEGRHYDASQNPVPEARAVRDAYDTYQPQWVIDIHNQGLLRVEDDADPAVNRPGAPVAGSVLWPTNEDVAPEAVDLSKQMAAVMKLRTQSMFGGQITRYPGGDYPGIARNAYGLLGSERIESGEEAPVGGSVLLEISGQAKEEQEIPNAATIWRRRVASEMIWAVLQATASGALYEVDPALAEQLIVDNDRSAD